jgi:hypothetical protein
MQERLFYNDLRAAQATSLSADFQVLLVKIKEK